MSQQLAVTRHAYRDATTLLEGVDVSSTTTYRGTPTDIRNWTSISYDLSWTGTPTGTFTVWVTNKDVPDLTSDADWKQLSLTTAITQPAGTASGDIVDITDIPYKWIRPKYVNASSTGRIFARWQLKGRNR